MYERPEPRQRATPDPLRESPVQLIARVVRTALHRTKLGFREARLSETGFPRIRVVGSAVSVV